MKINLGPLLRLLQPGTNGNGLHAIAMGVYAVVQVLVYHHPVGDPQVYIAAIGAIAALYNRSQVTPVSDPRIPVAALPAASEVHITTQTVKLATVPPVSGGVVKTT